MKVFLVVLFMINGEPAVAEGFLPRQQPSEKICAERRAYLLRHLHSIPDLPPIGVVKCVSAETGLNAAKQAVKHIGVPL